MPNAQCPMPNAQCPIPNAQCPIPYSHSFYEALIIGKKRVKLLTASIIEFDLLFNAHAYK
ncbi:MAG: hypothetical protein V7L23_02615 [Nostoc sp.]|uniref:hypothetical protein n=1 Tax=Nostoc sp. TaxID=1180 RepID=UPI002FF377D0